MSEEKEFVWTEELAKEYGKFCLEKQSHLQWGDFIRMKTTKFNWVVFTEDGFGYPTWEKRDWRGESRYNWNNSVKTFLTNNEAEEYIIMNKPCLSISDFEKCIKAHLLPDDMKTFYFKPMRELVKQKIQ